MTFDGDAYRRSSDEGSSTGSILQGIPHYNIAQHLCLPLNSLDHHTLPYCRLKSAKKGEKSTVRK